jgi:hypothetical protein
VSSVFSRALPIGQGLDLIGRTASGFLDHPLAEIFTLEELFRGPKTYCSSADTERR